MSNPTGDSSSLILAENVADWRGKEVLGPEGEKLGKLEELFYDAETDAPSFVAIKSGVIGKHLTLVPLLNASVGPDHLRVAYGKSQVKDAPSFDTGTELAVEDEATAFRFFEVPYTPTAQGGRRLAKR